MQVLSVLSKVVESARASVKPWSETESVMCPMKPSKRCPEIAGNPRQPKRSDPIDGEHVVERRSVVGKNHRSALTGPPQNWRLPNEDLPVRKIHAT